ncbi:2,3-dihydroxybenzoate-AMP ligase [Streptomyces xanthochromogenes]
MLKGCVPWPEGFVDRYWAAGHWRGCMLDNLLRDWALQYGPRTALVHGGTRLTYANLNRRVDRMAAAFRLRGLRPGQRVVVQLPNVPEFVITVFALMRAGVVPVLCPLSYRAPQVPHIVRVTQAVGYVGPSVRHGFDHTAMAAGIAAQWPFLRRVFTYDEPGTSSPYGGLTTDPAGCQYSPLAALDSPPGPPLALSADEVAFFELADRTGELPLLVPRTHNDYAYQVRAAAELVGLAGHDVYLAALPAESTFAFGGPGIVGALSVGGTAVLADSVHDVPGADDDGHVGGLGGQEPAAWLSAVGRERVTITSLTPGCARRLVDVLPAAQADLSSLRLVQICGEALPRETAERLAARLGCRLQPVFGLPEGLLVMTRPEDPDETVLGTHGRPLSPDDEIRIVDADGQDVPEGEPGELLARGPYTVRGHYREPDRNALAFTPEGYVRSGVLARRDPAGNVVVTGPLEGAGGGRHDR